MDKGDNRRCINCVNCGMHRGHARRAREAQRLQEVEAARQAQGRERLRLARIEQEERERREAEERERREAEEREERERQDRAKRDAAREESLNQRIIDVATMEDALRAKRRELRDELAALPAAQRVRLSGPVSAGLLPMDSWSHETCLSWWDETFTFSDLYRDCMRSLRMDGRLLALIRDSQTAERHEHLRYLGVTNLLHRERVAQELVTHVPGNSEAPCGGDAASSGVCVICVDQPAEWALLPCGHLCLCQSCCTELVRNRTAQTPTNCPICRGEVRAETRIFLAGLAGGADAAGGKRQRVD